MRNVYDTVQKCASRKLNENKNSNIDNVFYFILRPQEPRAHLSGDVYNSTVVK